MSMTTQLHSCEAGPDAGDQLAEELAACLARFLNASADERTMARARAALALWHQGEGGRPPFSGQP
jgi:hypothetical protein